jgi:hypothetical protein
MQVSEAASPGAMSPDPFSSLNTLVQHDFTVEVQVWVTHHTGFNDEHVNAFGQQLTRSYLGHETHTYKYDPTEGKFSCFIVTPADGAAAAIKKVLEELAKAPYEEVTRCLGDRETLETVRGCPDNNPFLARGPINLVCGASSRRLSEDGFTLLWAVQNDKLVIVTGAGASFSLTREPTSMWWPFLQTLIDRVWPPNQPRTVFDRELFARLEPHAQSEYVYLIASREGRLPDIANHIFAIMHGLQPRNRDPWFKALGRFCGHILTFNYDVALEVALTRSPVSVDDNTSFEAPGNTQGHPRNVIYHMHGIFTHDRSIVLRQESYLQAAKRVPGLMVQLAQDNKVFLYIGVTGVLSDPDLSIFWRHEGVQYEVGSRALRHAHFVFQINTRAVGTLPHDARDREFSFFRGVPYAEHDDIPKMLELLTQCILNRGTNMPTPDEGGAARPMPAMDIFDF